MKFLEIVGNASTTAWLNGKRIGYNVNATAYLDNENVVIKLESNATAVRGVVPVIMSVAEYEDFKSEDGRNLMLRGLDLFGCTTAF